MASVHLLNVGSGDCTIIQHNSGRVTLIDICGGNATRDRDEGILAKTIAEIAVKGNFRMCERPTHPLAYLDRLSFNQVFRFILTHPDMDYMDGLQALLDATTVANFWDCGIRRSTPDFDPKSRFREEDWFAYKRLIAGKQPDVRTLIKLAGARFCYANTEGPNGEQHDGLYILAPDKALSDQATATADPNDGSYALLYSSSGGRIVLPGDSDASIWEYVLTNHTASVQNCAFLLAPHHGRHSGMDCSFLDVLRPTLTLFGCAPSKDLAYEEWREEGFAIRHFQSDGGYGPGARRQANRSLHPEREILRHIALRRHQQPQCAG
jgi:beta-lactamase superfamily II metal-dependent hydrolase